MNPRIRMAGAVMLANLLMLVLPGCGGPCVRHGVVLRGDWSLELNRVPWVEHRHASESSQKSCAGSPSLGISDASEADCSQVTQLAPERRHVDTATCQVQQCPESPQPVVPAAYQGYPRFHPVPTHPPLVAQLSPAPPLAPLPEEGCWEPGLASPPGLHTSGSESSADRTGVTSPRIADPLKSKSSWMEQRTSWIFSTPADPRQRLAARLAAPAAEGDSLR